MKLESKRPTELQAIEAMQIVLQYVTGASPEYLMMDPDLNRTPARHVKALREMVASFDPARELYVSRIADIVFGNGVFPGEGARVPVTIGPTTVWGCCPHHLLPIRYRVVVRYLPAGKIVGLSKVPRLLATLSRALWTQEVLTTSICSAIQQSSLSPDGVACYVLGEHTCMSARGAGVDTVTETHYGTGKMADLANMDRFMDDARRTMRTGAQ